MGACLNTHQEHVVSARARERARLARWLLLPLAIQAGLVLAAAENEQRGFVIQAGEQLVLDDNLYRLPESIVVDEALLGAEGSRDDLVSRTSAAVLGRWAQGRQTFAMSVGVDANRFQQNERLDNTSRSAQASWEWGLGRRWSGRIGGDYQRSLSGFGSNRSLERDLFESVNYFGELEYRLLARWSLTGRLRQSEGSHDSITRRADDLDSTTAAAGLVYRTVEGDEIGVEYRRVEAEYPQQVIFAGQLFDRNYTENGASARFRYTPSAKTYIEGSAGRLERDYPQGSIGDFSGNVWNASLRWLPGLKTRISASGWKELKAYLDTEADHFVARGGKVSADWAATRKLSFSVQYSDETQRYIGDSLLVPTAMARRDRVRTQQVAASFAPRDYVSLDLSWRFEQRESNAWLYAYDDRIALLGLRFTF